MAAPTITAVGTAYVSPNNAANPMTVTGGSMPAHQAGDVLLMFAWFDTGATTTGQTLSTPAGWTALGVPADNLANGMLLHVYWKYAASSSETFTSPSYAGGTTGTSGATGIAQVVTLRPSGAGQRFRSNVTTAELVANQGTATFFTTAQQNIGAITGFTPDENDTLIVVVGGKRDDWTSVATLTGDSLTWTEQIESVSTSGADAGLVVDTAPQTTAGAITAKTFTVTGGATEKSAGIMFALSSAPVITEVNGPELDLKWDLIAEANGAALDLRWDVLSNYQTEVLADNPWGYWKLNEASGLVQDSSGNARHMTTTSGVTYGQTGALAGGQDDGAIRVDGTDQVSNSSLDLFQAASQLTFEGWIETDNYAGNAEWQTLVGDLVGQCGIFIADTGNLHLYRNSTTTMDWNGVWTQDNVWRHVVVTYDEASTANCKLYIDGVLKTRSAGSAGSFTATSSGMSIGMAYNTSSVQQSQVVGTIDEVAVYTGLLSEARIQAHYAAGTGTAAAPVNGPVLDLVWDTQAEANSAVTELVWDTRAAVDGGVLDLKWDLIAQVSSAVTELIWDTKAAVASAITELVWDTRAQADGGVLDLIWDTRAQADGIVLDLKWDTRAEANGSVLDLVWDTRSEVNGSVLDLIWDLRAQADGLVLELVWDLVTAGSVNGAVLDLVWDTRAEVASPVTELVWDIRSPVDGAITDLKWDVKATVDGAVTELLWDLKTIVNGNALDLVWDVLGYGAVDGPILDLLWDVKNQINGAALDLLWEIGGRVEAQLTLRWDLEGATAPQLPDLHELESSLAIELSLDPTVTGFAPFQNGPAEGPNTAASDATLTGAAWTNPTEIFVESGTGAIAALGQDADLHTAGSISDPDGWWEDHTTFNLSAQDGNVMWSYFGSDVGSSGDLYFTNFGFSIPTDATIEGIRVRGVWQWEGEGGVGGWLQLRKGSTYVGDYVTMWDWLYVPNGVYEVIYGGSGRSSSPTLWGTTWTPAQINASSFGVYCWAWGGAGAYPEIDYLAVDVLYSRKSQYLKATNFGFAIPGTATINGVKARVRAKTDADTTYLSMNDRSVKIVKGGTIGGTEKSTGGLLSSVDYTERVYGGPGDQWGQTWTPADINASTFGLVTSYQGYGNADVDYAELTVYYTEEGAQVAVTGQPKIRFGPEESFEGRVLTGTSFSTEMPGGFSAATFNVQRSEFLEPADYLYSSGRLLEYETGRVLHEGRVVGVTEGPDGEVSFELEGWAKSLSDNKTARQIFYDRDLSGWGSPSISRRLYLNGLSMKQSDGSVEPDPSNGVPAVTQKIEESGYHPILIVENTYNAQGLVIGKVDWAWKKSASVNTADTGWVWALWAGLDDTGSGATDTTGNLRTGATSGTLTTTNNDKEFAVVQFYWNAAATWPDGIAYSIMWTHLGVMGNHSVPIQGSVAAPKPAALSDRGVRASDVISYVIDTWADVLEVGDIQATTFTIPHLVFKDPTTPLQMIETCCAYGSDANFFPLDYYVYEDRKLGVADPTQHGTTWRVRYSDGVEANDAGPDVSAMLNGVYITYDDGAGTQKSVGPPNSGADFQDPALIDISDGNPANRDGSKHWEVFSGEVTSEGGAVRIGKVILADRNRQEWRGDITIKDWVRDSAGNRHPAALVRAGDYIVIEDDEDYRPRRVVNTTCDASAMTVSCSIGAEPDRHDVLLAHLGVVLEGQL